MATTRSSFVRFDLGEYADTPLVRALVEAMRAKKISPRRLGQMSGMSGDAVRNILRGRSKDPRSDTITALANTLGLDASALLQGTRKAIERAAVNYTPEPPPDDHGTLYTVGVYSVSHDGEPDPAGSLRELRRVGDWTMPTIEIRAARHEPDDCLMLIAPDDWAPLARMGDRLLIDVAQRTAAPGVWIAWDGWQHSVVRLEGAGPGRLRVAGGGDWNPEAYTICGRVAGRWTWL